MRTVLILAFESLRFGMGQRDIPDRCKSDTVQFIGDIESAVADIIQFQVRTHLVLVQIELRFFRFFKIITPVPAFRLEVTAFFPDFGIDIGQLLFGLSESRCPDFVQQGIYFIRRFRHAIFQDEGSIIVISHQFRLFEAQGDQIADDFLIVGLIAVIAPVDVAVEDFLTQSAVIRILQERHHTRIMQREKPFPLHPGCFSCFGRIRNQAFGQAGKVFLFIDHQLKIVCFLQHVLAESKLKHGNAAVQLTQLLLFVGRQIGSATNKILIGFFQQFLLLLVQIEFGLVVINGLHTVKKGRIQADIVTMFRKQRREFAAERLHFVIRIYAVLAIKHGTHPFQQLSALVERDNCIFKIRHGTLFHDRIDLLFLFFHTLQKSRLVIG